MRDCLPLLMGLTPFGLVVGIVSQGAGLSLPETALMNGVVYAGAAQLVALSAWGVPAPVSAAALAALVVNLRLVLFGPVLAPWLDRVRGWRLWGSLFLMVDGNWAMSVGQIRAGQADAGYLFGSGAVLWAAWITATAAGWLLGSAFRPPAGHPVFFAALAAFVSMLVTMWRGRTDFLPWLVAAVTAWGTSRLLHGTSWHIVAGAMTGAAAGMLRDRLFPATPDRREEGTVG